MGIDEILDGAEELHSYRDGGGSDHTRNYKSGLEAILESQT